MNHVTRFDAHKETVVDRDTGEVVSRAEDPHTRAAIRALPSLLTFLKYVLDREYSLEEDDLVDEATRIQKEYGL